MITLTTPTQEALARIATAPATSEQRRPAVQLADRLARAACPMAVLRPCPAPCQDCRRFAERVAVELVRVVRETQTTGDER
jgi:hypothetical protein